MRNPKNNNEIYTITEALNANLETSKQAIKDSAKCAAISIFASRILDACELFEKALLSLKCEKCKGIPSLDMQHNPKCYCNYAHFCENLTYISCSECNGTYLNKIAAKALADAKAL